MSRFLLAAILAAALLARPAIAAEDDAEKSAGKLITPPAQQAIDRALVFLVANQQEDGSFGSGAYRGNTAVTGLAGMAFLANGSTPGRGPYGKNLARTIDYLLAKTQESGFIVASGAPSHGPMYGHGFAAMFLAECYGMSPRPELREKLGKAIRLIVDCQNKEGGWRYQPQRQDADISVTVCEVMALRAAHNAGLFVPRETIDRSIDYVKRCQNPDGGFMYTLGQGEERSAFGRSAAGVVALYSAGVYQGPEIAKGLDYLMGFLPQPGVIRRENYYYYGHYYAAQAMWRAGGPYWNRWFPAVRDELVTRQRKDGSWMCPISVETATAMSAVVLQIPNNFLPIIQR